FYLNFSDFEIRHGYKRKALAILTKALDRFSDDDEQSQVKSANKSENIEKDAFIVFERLQDITSKHFGVLELRKLYEKAINYFDVAENSLKIALEFAKFEQDLGEIDRSRTILAYSAQIANPEKFPKFWDYWQQFEVQFGNDQTVREMLRIKRSVKVQFEQSVRGFEAGHHSNEGQQSLEEINNLQIQITQFCDIKLFDGKVRSLHEVGIQYNSVMMKIFNNSKNRYYFTLNSFSVCTENINSFLDPMNNLELKASNSGDKKILGPDHSQINFVSTSSNQEKIYKNPDEIDISQSQSESASEQEILFEEKVPGFLSALAENTSQNSPRD
ncbi:MAG: Pre-mRNA-splicing factor SYF1, partial [Paramarteilia canceri]